MTRRLWSLIGILAMVCLSVNAESIVDRMHTRDLANWQYVDFYLRVFTNEYLNYPFVVRVSILVVLLCCVSMLYFALLLLFTEYRDARDENFYDDLCEKYFDKVVGIMNTQEEMEYGDVVARLDVTPKDLKRLHKGRGMFLLGKMLIKVKTENYETYSLPNLQHVANAFGLPTYVKEAMAFGSTAKRRLYMQVMQTLMLEVPESVLVRLLNTSSPLMRKEVRMFYIWLCDYNPFRFFQDDNYNYEYRPWDALEIHHMLRLRKRAGKEMPSLPPVVLACPDEDLKACLIREIGFWGKEEEVTHMDDFLESQNPELRMAAIDCMGVAHNTRDEDKLMEMYPLQPRTLKLHVLKTIMDIHSGKATDFLVKSWQDANESGLKLNLLYCLWNYSDESRAEFERLEEACREEMQLFEQVRVMSTINSKAVA